jgi:hypothetical protein
MAVEAPPPAEVGGVGCASVCEDMGRQGGGAEVSWFVRALGLHSACVLQSGQD